MIMLSMVIINSPIVDFLVIANVYREPTSYVWLTRKIKVCKSLLYPLHQTKFKRICNFSILFFNNFLLYHNNEYNIELIVHFRCFL